MLNHRIARNLFLLIVLLLAAFAGYGALSWWWLTLPTGLFVFLLFIGTVMIRARYFLPLRNHGDRSRREVALTFDDGPRDITLPIARCLDKHGVQGTFFLIGENVRKKPEVVEELVRSGHTVGNHGYYHKWWFPLRWTRNMVREMEACEKAIEQAAGVRPRWFRPPFGLTNPRVAAAVLRHEVVPVGWDVRSYDTVIGTSSMLSARLRKSVRPGSIILLHDTNEELVAFLDAFLPWLQSEGFKVVPLEKMIHETPYRD